MKQKQIWKCQGCGHQFYRPMGQKQSLVRRIFRRAERIECEVCHKVMAIKIRVVNFKD